MFQNRKSRVNYTPRSISTSVNRVANSAANRTIAKKIMKQFNDGDTLTIAEFQQTFANQITALGLKVPSNNRSMASKLALMHAYITINDHYLVQAGMRLKAKNYYKQFVVQKDKEVIISFYRDKSVRAIARMDAIVKG